MFILIYVDDILIIGTSRLSIQEFIVTLNKYFSLKDFGPLQFFLGIEAHWHSDGSMVLTQTKYDQHLLHKVGMAYAKP